MDENAEQSQVNFELLAQGHYENVNSIPGEWWNHWWAIRLDNAIDFKGGEQLTEAMQESIADQLTCQQEWRAAFAGDSYVDSPSFWPDILAGRDMLIEQSGGLDI